MSAQLSPLPSLNPHNSDGDTSASHSTASNAVHLYVLSSPAAVAAAAAATAAAAPHPVPALLLSVIGYAVLLPLSLALLLCALLLMAVARTLRAVVTGVVAMCAYAARTCNCASQASERDRADLVDLGNSGVNACSGVEFDSVDAAVTAAAETALFVTQTAATTATTVASVATQVTAVTVGLALAATGLSSNVSEKDESLIALTKLTHSALRTYSQNNGSARTSSNCGDVSVGSAALLSAVSQQRRHAMLMNAVAAASLVLTSDILTPARALAPTSRAAKSSSKVKHQQQQQTLQQHNETNTTEASAHVSTYCVSTPTVSRSAANLSVRGAMRMAAAAPQLETDIVGTYMVSGGTYTDDTDVNETSDMAQSGNAGVRTGPIASAAINEANNSSSLVVGDEERCVAEVVAVLSPTSLSHRGSPSQLQSQHWQSRTCSRSRSQSNSSDANIGHGGNCEREEHGHASGISANNDELIQKDCDAGAKAEAEAEPPSPVSLFFPSINSIDSFMSIDSLDYCNNATISSANTSGSTNVICAGNACPAPLPAPGGRKVMLRLTASGATRILLQGIDEEPQLEAKVCAANVKPPLLPVQPKAAKLALAATTAKGSSETNLIAKVTAAAPEPKMTTISTSAGEETDSATLQPCGQQPQTATTAFKPVAAVVNNGAAASSVSLSASPQATPGVLTSDTTPISVSFPSHWQSLQLQHQQQLQSQLAPETGTHHARVSNANNYTYTDVGGCHTYTSAAPQVNVLTSTPQAQRSMFNASLSLAC